MLWPGISLASGRRGKRVISTRAGPMSGIFGRTHVQNAPVSEMVRDRRRPCWARRLPASRPAVSCGGRAALSVSRSARPRRLRSARRLDRNARLVRRRSNGRIIHFIRSGRVWRMKSGRLARVGAVSPDGVGHARGADWLPLAPAGPAPRRGPPAGPALAGVRPACADRSAKRRASRILRTAEIFRHLDLGFLLGRYN